MAMSRMLGTVADRATNRSPAVPACLVKWLWIAFIRETTTSSVAPLPASACGSRDGASDAAMERRSRVESALELP